MKRKKLECAWCFDQVTKFATNFTKEAEGKFFCRVQCADSYTEDVKVQKKCKEQPGSASSSVGLTPTTVFKATKTDVKTAIQEWVKRNGEKQASEKEDIFAVCEACDSELTIKVESLDYIKPYFCDIHCERKFELEIS